MSQLENRFVTAAVIIGGIFGLLVWSALLAYGYSTSLQDTSSWPILVQLLGLGLGIALLPALWFGFAWMFEKFAVRVRLTNEHWIRRMIRE